MTRIRWSSASHFWKIVGAEALLVAPLSVLFLGGYSLWLDEGYTARIVRLNWGTFWRVVSEEEGMHGLTYVILKFWTTLGDSEAMLRAPSLVFAAGAVAALALLGRELFGSRIGLTAGLLFAVNPFLLRYAQEARDYALTALLATVASYAFVRLIRRPQKRWLAAYIVLSALAAYAHMFAVLMVVAHALSFVVGRRRAVPTWMVVAAMVGIGVLLIPLGLFLLTTDREQASWIQPTHVIDLVRHFTKHAGSRWLLLPYFGLAVLGLLPAWRSRGGGGPATAGWPMVVVLLWLAIPTMAVFLVSFAKPLFVSRYLIGSLPPLVLLVAMGMSQLRPAKLFVGGLMVVVVLSVLALPEERRELEEWRGATELIRSEARAGDVIIFHDKGIQAPYDYYRERLGDSEAPPTVVAFDPGGTSSQPGQSASAPAPWGLDRLLDAEAPRLDEVPPGRVWLVLAYGSEVELVRDSLDRSHEFNSEWSFDAIRVLLYDARATP